VGTVEEKLDRRTVFTDSRFTPSDYLNILIRPENGGWRYDEEDRPNRTEARHPDWLWRIAAHGRTTEEFYRQYRAVDETGWFTDAYVPVADNYILFHSTDQTYVAKKPPMVAEALLQPDGENEDWINPELHQLTIGEAAQHHRTQRAFLRIKNRTHRNVHVELPFFMRSELAVTWRKKLIDALKQYDSPDGTAR